MPTKIVVTDYLEPDFNWEKEQLRAKGFDFAWQEFQLQFGAEEELVPVLADADVIVVNMARLTAGVISQLRQCKLIIRHGIGYDNVDLPAATAQGIRVANIPDYCVEEVAEQTVMLILGAIRHLGEQQAAMAASVAKGQWDFSPVSPVHLMQKKILGIIGCGRIGSSVLRKMQCFNMKCLVCDPYLSLERCQELKIEPVALDRLLGESDVVTLHTPFNDETRGLINRRTLALMKKTAVLINTARGPLIVEGDLAAALRNGRIAGAALDVYQLEPPSPDNPLLGLPNCLLTPHLSWYSEESGWSIREKILEDIVLHLEGRPPRFTVNAEVEKILAGRAK